MEIPPLAVLLEIMLRAGIIYAVILLGFRLAGKQRVGQTTPFDLVLLLLIANVVENAIVGGDESLLGGIVAAMTLLGIDSLVGKTVFRSWTLRKLIEGQPTMLVYKGKLLQENIRNEEVASSELAHAMRQHGVASLEQIYLAMLEIDGNITIVRTDDAPTDCDPPKRMG